LCKEGKDNAQTTYFVPLLKGDARRYSATQGVKLFFLEQEMQKYQLCVTSVINFFYDNPYEVN